MKNITILFLLLAATTPLVAIKNAQLKREIVTSKVAHLKTTTETEGRRRSISRERELSIEHDTERTRAMTSCIDFSRTLTSVAVTVITIIMGILAQR